MARAGWWSKDTVAVVTGANRGIGLEIVRVLAGNGLTVVLTARDPAKGQAATDSLKAEGFESVVFHPLATSSAESAEKLAQWLAKEFGGIDILVNNAGIAAHISSVSYEGAQAVVGTNYYGTKSVTEKLMPLLRASPAGARIVNVTSRMGTYSRLPGESGKKRFGDASKYSTEYVDSLASKYYEDVKAGRAGEEGWLTSSAEAAMYTESKIFQGAYSMALAKSLSKSQPENHQIFVTSHCPGATQTGMMDAALDAGFVVPEGMSIKSVADGADTAVWLALLPKAELLEKTGKFFAERREYAFASGDYI